MEVCLHPSILQTDYRKYLFNKIISALGPGLTSFRLRLRNTGIYCTNLSESTFSRSFSDSFPSSTHSASKSSRNEMLYNKKVVLVRVVLTGSYLKETASQKECLCCGHHENDQEPKVNSVHFYIFSHAQSIFLFLHQFKNMFLIQLQAGQDGICERFKEAVSRDFRTLFFLLIEPIWAPDKQVKMVFLENSFSRRFSNLKFEKFDSENEFLSKIILACISRAQIASIHEITK